MREKIILLILMIVITFTSCSVDKNSSYYLRPTNFSNNETKIIELLDMNDNLLFYEYNLPDDINVLEFSFETYKDGVMISNKSIQTGLEISGKKESRGELVISIINGDDYSVAIKHITSIFNNISKFKVSKHEEIKKSNGFSEKFRTEKINIADEREIVIGVYTFDIGNGIRTSSIEQFQNADTSIEGYKLYMLFKIRLLEDFEDNNAE